MEIKTITDHRIAKEFFRRYTTGAEVSKKLYPKSCSYFSKNKNSGSVTNILDKLKESNYINEKLDVIWKVSLKGIRFPQRIPKFRLNLNPYFEYANEKLKESRLKQEEGWLERGKSAKDKKDRKAVREVLSSLKEKEFNEIEKKFLNYIFDMPKTRELACKRENLFDGISNVLEKIFFYEQVGGDVLAIQFAKGFLTENKRHLQGNKDHYKQFKLLCKKIDEFLSLLMTKLREIIGYDIQDYGDLGFDDKIKRYIHIPYDIYEKDPKEVKDNLLRRFEIVFYENREPTGDELFSTRL